jgi:hypothetical protein
LRQVDFAGLSNALIISSIRQREPETAACAYFTLHADRSTHGFDQRLGDREAQTTAVRVSIGLIAIIRRMNVLWFLIGLKPLPRSAVPQ